MLIISPPPRKGDQAFVFEALLKMGWSGRISFSRNRSLIAEGGLVRELGLGVLVPVLRDASSCTFIHSIFCVYLKEERRRGKSLVVGLAGEETQKLSSAVICAT